MLYQRVGLVALFLYAGLASAQVYPPGGGGYPGGGYPPGGYPPGGYPPGGYPGGRGPGIPIPGRRSKDSTKQDTTKALPNFRGALKRMDDKTITLELEDHRELDFKRNGKTKFISKGEEIKSPNISPGDPLSIEASEDATGYFTAVNVYWEKPEAKKPEEKPKEAPTTASAQAEEPAAPPRPAVTEVKPAAPDPDDPGPPKLKRGGVADPSRQHAKEEPPAPAPIPVQQAQVSPAETIAPRLTVRRDDDDIIRDENAPIDRRKLDPLIRKATDAALSFTETLPDYVVQEHITRYQSESRPPNFQPIDTVSTNLVYKDGKEDYKDITINGKPFKGKNMEETGGAWSTGEFGTVLIDLFSPATAADFHYRRESRIAGVTAKVYDYEVERERSHWQIKMASQMYMPAYNGTVWIDPSTGRVLRIEMQAHGFPEAFPADTAESAVDYQYIRLGDAKQYLLPVHAEILSCLRGTSDCSRNSIDFRNYHKFAGESTITFGTTKEEKK
jgi:hypothetical protein